MISSYKGPTLPKTAPKAIKTDATEYDASIKVL